MLKTFPEQYIEIKIKQAQNNISNIYKLYLNDLQGIKTLAPIENKHLIEATILEIDLLHENLMRYVDAYLRPFITNNIHRLMILDKFATPANGIPSESHTNGKTDA